MLITNVPDRLCDIVLEELPDVRRLSVDEVTKLGTDLHKHFEHVRTDPEKTPYRLVRCLHAFELDLQ